jgi:S1-C subfamily serine protease
MRYLQAGLVVISLALTSSAWGQQRPLAGFRYVYVQGSIDDLGRTDDSFAEFLRTAIEQDPSWEVVTDVQHVVSDRRALSATLICTLDYRVGEALSFLAGLAYLPITPLTVIIRCTDILGTEVASAEAEVAATGAPKRAFARAVARAFEEFRGARQGYDSSETVDILELLPAADRIGMDPSTVPLYLTTTSTSAIEGIWSTEDGSERMGVIRDSTASDHYVAFNLQSRSPLWEPGMIRGRLSETGKGDSFAARVIHDDRKEADATGKLSGDVLSIRSVGSTRTVHLVRVGTGGIPRAVSPAARPRRQIGSAGCYAASRGGELVTTYTAVKDAGSVGVKFAGELELEAAVRATDPANDLAVLSVERTTDAFLLAPGGRPVRGIENGRSVFAFSYSATEPAGVGPRLIKGVVRTRKVKGAATLITTSLPLGQVESGSPIVNAYADVIGVATSAPVESGRPRPRDNSFAVTADHIGPLLEKVVGVRDDWPNTSGTFEARIDALRLHQDSGTSLNVRETIDRSVRSLCRVFLYE